MHWLIPHRAKEWIAPSSCAYCKIFLSTSDFLCGHCKAMIKPVASTALYLSKKYTMRVFAISGYHDPLKQLILAKGWSDIVISNILGELMWDMTYIQYVPIDYFIPIPLHWTRKAYRGFNQTEEMARALSFKSGKPVAGLLKRIKRTQFQSAIAAESRAENVREAFILCGDDRMYHDKHLVLVDDLMTTGATLQSAAKELITLKPASITALTVCRTI